MEQAHHAVLVLEGAGFHDGADQHFDEAAAHGIQHHRNEDAHKRQGQQVGQNGHQGQPRRRQDLGDHHTGAVADLISKPGGRQVNEQLRQVEHQRDQGDFFQRDAVGALEGEKEKRGKVGGDGLGDKAQVTGRQGLFVFVLF